MALPRWPRRRMPFVGLVTACLLATRSTPAEAQRCGDADASTAITVSDGILVLRAAAGLAGSCPTAAVCDLDGDGRITLSDGVNVLRLAAGLSALTACPIVPSLRLTAVASGLSAPLFASGVPGDPTRLYILEQEGFIRIVENGELQTIPFLDLTTLTSKGSERGLLGLAFHPDYPTNGRFYVNYTDVDGNTVVAEYRRTAVNPNRAEVQASRILRTIVQPFPNHNGGMLAFGADGFLYIALGDGGNGRNPNGNGQILQTKLGKVLRISVDGDTPPPGTRAGADPDVWDFGLRNPFRFSFDRATGDLYIADVGEGRFEEIDVEPRGQGGRNYGWNVMEGFACFESRTDCDQNGLTLPTIAYSHVSDDCAVIGGYVYRGMAIPGLVGRYLYGDFCSRRIRSFVWDGSMAVGELDLSDALESPAKIAALSSFGEDAHGELYVCDLGGGIVYRIDPQ